MFGLQIKFKSEAECMYFVFVGFAEFGKGGLLILAEIDFLINVVAFSLGEVTQKIAETTTSVSLIAIGLFGLAYLVGYLFKGAPVPWKDIKEFGHGLTTDAIRSALMLALWTSILSLITWVVSVVALAGA